MTNKQLAELIAKLKAMKDRRETEYAQLLTREEAEFVLELISKNWR